MPLPDPKRTFGSGKNFIVGLEQTKKNTSLSLS